MHQNQPILYVVYQRSIDFVFEMRYTIDSSGTSVKTNIWYGGTLCMLKIGKVIKAKRKECDLTQEELATLLGVTKAADQQIRNRKKSIPRELQGQISFLLLKK